MSDASDLDRLINERLDTLLPKKLEELRAKKALNDMQSGQVLKIVATDPGSVKDFQAFAKQTGNDLLSQAEANKEFTFFLKRK